MLQDAIKLNTKQARPVVQATFPEYKGRKFSIEFTTTVTMYDTNWGGGTRNVYKFVRSDGNVASLPSFAPWNNPVEGKTVDLPENVMMVEHSDFCGHDMGIRIYAHPVWANKYLPAPKA